eukprot:4115934-Amphidinium_carterae.1
MYCSTVARNIELGSSCSELERRFSCITPQEGRLIPHNGELQNISSGKFGVPNFSGMCSSTGSPPIPNSTQCKMGSSPSAVSPLWWADLSKQCAATTSFKFVCFVARRMVLVPWLCLGYFTV